MSELKPGGVIHELNFLPDKQTFDSLQLLAYWDDFSLPAIEVLTVDSMSGYTSFFLMPFAKSARIAIVNAGFSAKRVSGSVKYQLIPIDRSLSGYFHAVYHETNPTRYGEWHPILHERGKGRYIGTILEIPHISQWCSLEGNPRFVIDSTLANSFEFTGTEDYFDGGWYFRDGIFSLPFAGCINYPDNLYRFQVLDAVDFTKSIDVDIQHGNNNDVHEDYRSLAFYYLHHTPFLSNLDTIRSGEHWIIKGAGYDANVRIKAQLGNYFLFDTTANSNGAFQINIIVPSSWRPGVYTLSINNEESPQPIVIVSHPELQVFSDLTPLSVSTGDSLGIEGFGFTPGEKVNLFLGSTKLETSDQILVNEDYHFITSAKIPRLPKNKYALSATGSISGIALYPDSIPYTGLLNYEFEDLLANSVISGGQSSYQRVSYYWYAEWSKQAFAFFQPNAIGDSLTFHFTIPWGL